MTCGIVHFQRTFGRILVASCDDHLTDGPIHTRAVVDLLAIAGGRLVIATFDPLDDVWQLRSVADRICHAEVQTCADDFFSAVRYGFHQLTKPRFDAELDIESVDAIMHAFNHREKQNTLTRTEAERLLEKLNALVAKSTER